MPPPVVNTRRSRPSTGEPGALRADAAQNRLRLIATAESMFATEGLGVSVESIAKRANLGIGTLYRHFPTKDALIAAIVVTRIDAMAAHAEQLATASDAGAAITIVMERLVAEAATKKDFVAAIGGVDKLVGIACVKDRFKAALNVLIERAQAAKALRSDVTPSDVLALIHGLTMATPDDAQARMRQLAIVLDGLRVRR